MGFYGNITSTNKTQFTFDRIYPNRKTMDNALKLYVTEGDTSTPGDGVFIGRFVLVDYEDGKTGYFPIFKKDDSGIFYADSSFKTIMTTALCKANDIFQYQAGSTLEFWQATGNSASTIIDEETVEYATFIQVTNSKYEANYKVDTAPAPEGYGPGRGYDGTVWQKVFAEGKEKYVMVAELNSVVPTFKITADAPTMTPIEPHFDKQSNNVAYWLHWQPQWGMRVQEAKNVKDKDGNEIHDEDGNPIKYSDAKVTWINSVYNPITHQIDPREEQKDGNIYFNKAGLSKEIRSYHEMDDKVSVTPTGISGYKYQGHNIEPQEAVDIQEISILLPSIGNAISDAWDVVYGIPKTANNKRNLDIEWDSLKGNRMVEVGGTGYKFDKENANSLAGCINSVHDLMGMIIMEQSVTDPKDADSNSIYYNSEKGIFERKHTTYTYTEVPSVEDKYTYEKKPGADLLKWEPGQYYYKDSLENYFVDKGEKPDLSRNYYSIQIDEQSLTPEYIQNKWWYKEGNNYQFGDEKEVKENTVYYILNEEGSHRRWYKKNQYFYKEIKPSDPDDIAKPYLIATHEKLNPNYTYYRIDDKYDILDLPEQTITYEKSPGEYVTVTSKVIPPDANIQKISNLTQFELNKFYTCSNHYKYPDRLGYTGDFTLITEEPKEKLTYAYTLAPTQIDPFYETNKYYLLTAEGYLKDRAGKYNSENVYYQLITETKITKEFYVEGEYFEKEDPSKEDSSYIPSLDKNPINKDYYEKKGYYVIEDELGELPVGMEWNEEIISWPNTLHIGTRDEQYEMQEIKGFARSFNTIHGLILEIRKLLDTGHAYTRDENTVQGAINKLKDIIAKFENLQPGKLILIDNYGRVHPTDTINNSWIEWDVKPDPVNPSIEVKHKEAFETVTTVSQENTNPKFGETITTPEVAIDANGHVSSVKNENITLPKPSLTTNGSGVLTSASLVEETGALTANYTALSDVKLDGYGKTTATGDILATDSLEIGLSKLENAIAFTNDALEDVDAQLREDFAAEDAAIRSEFAAADTTLQNNIDTVNTSLGNRITAIENKGDFGVGALTTRVETNENKLTGISTTVADSITNAVNELSTGQVETNKGAIEGLDTRVSTVETTLKDVPSVGAALESTHQRIEGVENRVSVIEDQFKDSDIAEDGTETPRTYGLVRWYNQAAMPAVESLALTLWFDTNTGEIKLYNGLTWMVLSATIVE